MAKKKPKTIQYNTWKRTWKGEKDAFMRYYWIENNVPKHDVIGFEHRFPKKAKSPQGSIYQQTLIQSGEMTLEEAMTVVTGLTEAILVYIHQKEEKTKKRFY